MRQRRSTSSGSASTTWWLAAIAFFSIGLPLLAGALSGNLTIPHNDSWAQSRIAATFAHTGELRLVNWNMMTIVGLVVILGPLGSSMVAQVLVEVVLGVVCIFLVHDLLAAELPHRRALFGTAVFAIWPGFALLSTSFMTDVPALAGTLGSLVVGRRALERDSRLLLGIALAIAFWGFTVRQQALAAPAALLLYGYVTARQPRHVDRRTILAGTAIFAVAAIALLLWRGTLPESNPPELLFMPHAVIGSLVPGYFTLATALLPAIALGVSPLRWPRPALACAVAVTLFGLVWKLLGQSFQIGNYFGDWAPYPTVPVAGIYSLRLIAAIDFAAVIGSALMTGKLLTSWRNRSPLLSIFTAFTVAGTAASALAGQYVYDRFLLPLLPWLLITLLAPETNQTATPAGPPAVRPSWHRVTLTAASFTAVTAISTTVALAALANDRMRWSVASDLVAAGVPATTINAGLEWAGSHSPTGAIWPRATGSKPPVETFWRGSVCVQLATYARTPELRGNHRLTLMTTRRFRTFLLFGASTVYVFDTHQQGCAQQLTKFRN